MLSLAGNTLTKEGPGMVRLSGSGAGSDGGTLTVNAGTGPDDSLQRPGHRRVGQRRRATFDIQGNSNTISSLTVAGGSVLGSGTLTLGHLGRPAERG